MTPQELKNSILQQAIQGKLVEQRPEEGTAEELFQQIQKEKQRLIADGKIKKEKKLPEITEDEKPFDIPESWKWVRLGELIRVIGGVSYKKNDVSTNGLRILRGGNIKNTKVYLNEDDVFLPLSYEDSEKQVRKDDIIIVASTGSKTVIGKAGFIESDIPNTMIGAFLRICRPYFFYIVDYIKCIFNSEYYRNHIRTQVQGTNINNIKESHIAELAIPLPPLTEQKRIVAKIEELLPYIDRYEESWLKLEALNSRFPSDMKKSLLQYAIQGKLVEQRPEEGTAEELFQQIQKEKQRLIADGKIKKEKPLPEITEEEKPFDIPESWKWVRWGEIVNIVSARRVHQSDWKTKGVPFYRAREIAKLADNGFVNNELFISEELYEEFSKTGFPSSGDLMVTAVGTLGKCYIVKDSDKFYYKDASVICLENYAHLFPKYLRFIMDSEMLKNQIRSNSGGTTVATLTMVRMEQYMLPLPPLAEQKRIVAKLEQLLLLCERLKKIGTRKRM